VDHDDGRPFASRANATRLGHHRANKAAQPEAGSVAPALRLTLGVSVTHLVLQALRVATVALAVP
jgi:hypothetical protein